METKRGGCKYQYVVTDEDGNPVDSFPKTADMKSEDVSVRLEAALSAYPTATTERRAY